MERVILDALHEVPCSSLSFMRIDPRSRAVAFSPHSSSRDLYGIPIYSSTVIPGSHKSLRRGLRDRNQAVAVLGRILYRSSKLWHMLCRELFRDSRW